MLNIKETESKNIVEVTGILNELEVTTGTSKKTNKDYVSATAKIRLDQDINGVVTENIIPVGFYANKLKNDGTENKMYKRILEYGQTLISATAAEDPSMASKVKISGASLTENAYYRQDGTLVEKNFAIRGSFINKQRDTDEEGATFEVSGVVGKMLNEVDKDGQETGRLFVDFIIIGYNGVAHVIRMVAEGASKAHIENNWNQGDTVNVNGKINMYSSIRIVKEEQGFGEPIERKIPEFRQELVIIGGSKYGLDEAYSYDSGDVKVAIDERAAYLKSLEQAKKATTTSTAKKPNFGF